MSSRCVGGSQFGRAQVHELAQEQEEEEREYRIGSMRVPSSSSGNLDPMSNYEFTELTWENGQLAMHGLGDLRRQQSSSPSNDIAAAAKSLWVNRSGSPETLESIIHRACWKEPPNGQNQQASRILTNGLDKDSNKRARLDDLGWYYCGAQEEDAGDGEGLARGQARSACGSASVAFENRDDNDDATMMISWAASEGSLRSFNTTQTAHKASKTWEETQGEEEDGTRSKRPRSRRSRAAAIHNESERRRRDKINQRMRTLQKLVPNASKADKVSILDHVIEYMKQLQSQVQLMSFRTNLPNHLVPASASPAMGMHNNHHHHQLQMSILAAAAQMGSGGFVPPAPFVMPPMLAHGNRESNRLNASVPPLPDPYSAFLQQQRASMELYNKMAAAIYRQHSNQTTQATNNNPSSTNQEQGD